MRLPAAGRYSRGQDWREAPLPALLGYAAALGLRWRVARDLWARHDGEQATPGVAVVGVLRRGPADLGGLRPGDVVLSIDGRPVADTPDLINRIAAVAPGTAVALTLEREGRQQVLSVRVGKRPVPSAR